LHVNSYRSVFFLLQTYYSNVNKDRDSNSGLVGPLVICRDKSAAQSDQGSHIVVVSVTEETKSWYINDTIQDQITKGDVGLSTDMVVDPAFIQRSRIYGNDFIVKQFTNYNC